MNPNSAKLRERIEAAKQRSHGRIEGKIKSTPIPERQVKAIEMGFAYEAVLGRYKHCPTLQYFKLGKDGFRSRTITFLFKAATLADTANVSYTTWVESQFYWFHKWFRRPPKIQELSGQGGKFPASRRYQDFTKLQLQGQVTSDKLPREPTSKEELDKINAERLQQLCGAWGLSEIEIIAQFGQSGIFDAAWLKRNAIFQQLKREQKLL